MAGTYALSKVVYKELRDTIGPWAKAQGFSRRPEIAAGWQKNLDADRVLYFQFEVSAWGDPDIGNSLNGLVQLEPHPGGITATPIRQSYFTVCLLRPELDRLARIQGAINVRRPRVPASLESDMGKDTRAGDLLRSRYDPSPAYQEGQLVPLAYYTLADVRDFSGFILDVLDRATTVRTIYRSHLGLGTADAFDVEVTYPAAGERKLSRVRNVKPRGLLTVPFK